MFYPWQRLIPVGDKTMLPTKWLHALIGAMAVTTMVAATAVYGLFDMAEERRLAGLAAIETSCAAQLAADDRPLSVPIAPRQR